jgi:hypothetical protein
MSAPPAPIGAYLQPAFPFVGSSVARPGPYTARSRFPAEQSQRDANARIHFQQAQSIVPHVGNPPPSLAVAGLQALQNMNLPLPGPSQIPAGSLVSQKKCLVRLMKRSFAYETLAQQRASSPTYKPATEHCCEFTLIVLENNRTNTDYYVLIAGFICMVPDRPWSSTSNFIRDDLVPHVSRTSAGIGGPSRHKDFVDGWHVLALCTGGALSTVVELAIDSMTMHTTFDLQLRGMDLGKGGRWNIWLRLDVDNSSYDNLKLEHAQEEFNAEEAGLQLAELQAQTLEARIERGRAERARFRAQHRESRSVIEQWDLERLLVRTTTLFYVLSLGRYIFLLFY